MLSRFKNATRASIAVALAAFVLSTSGALSMSIPSAWGQNANPVVVLETTKGNITIELYPAKAPKTVENFLKYVDNKFYDGLIFHRVISGFMIQGGGFTKDMVNKKGNPPIQNEAENGLKNDRGTIAMARTAEPHSASSQFFINLVDNAALNFKNKNPQGWGYAVFGKVIDGMEIVDAIAGAPTAKKNGYDDVPVTPISINKAYRSDAKKKVGEVEKKG